jgi:hypothetical protein
MRKLLPTDEELIDKLAKKLPLVPEKWHNRFYWVIFAVIVVGGGLSILFSDSDTGYSGGSGNVIGGKIFSMMLKSLF